MIHNEIPAYALRAYKQNGKTASTIRTLEPGTKTTVTILKWDNWPSVIVKGYGTFATRSRRSSANKD